jgi:hypothetical protein
VTRRRSEEQREGLAELLKREIKSFLSGQLASGRTQELQSELLAAGIPLSLFALMWSRANVIGLFSNNVVSFSRNVVLRDYLFSVNVVRKSRMLSVRAVYVLSSLQVGTVLKPEDHIQRAQASWREARRDYESLGVNAENQRIRIDALYRWKDSAQDYFSKQADAFFAVMQQTRGLRNIQLLGQMGDYYPWYCSRIRKERSQKTDSA